MQCPVCASEEFDVIKVKRNMVNRNGAWKVSLHHDSREVVCKGCNSKFITETYIISKYEFNVNTLQNNIRNIQGNLFDKGDKKNDVN